ncbi:MAG: ribosome-associated translation inhibitor RaiA [Pseudomonadota bacterium]
MKITVTGKGLDVGDALRLHVETRVGTALEKFFDRPVEGTVVFARDGHQFRCDSSMHLPTGLSVNARASANEIYAAFDQVADRIEKQLRRHKRRLKSHHMQREAPIEQIQADAYVLQSTDEEDDRPLENGHEPLIIAEMKTAIKSLTVGEAVMQMELAHSHFLIFKNQASGRLNVVFQRDDGNIGWVDPANLSGA